MEERLACTEELSPAHLQERFSDSKQVSSSSESSGYQSQSSLASEEDIKEQSPE